MTNAWGNNYNVLPMCQFLYLDMDAIVSVYNIKYYIHTKIYLNSCSFKFPSSAMLFADLDWFRQKRAVQRAFIYSVKA